MKKHKKKVIALIIVVLIVSIIIFFAIKNKKTNSFEQMPDGMGQFMNENMENEKDKMSQQLDKSDRQSKKSTTTLKTQGEIQSALTEQVELHATYYLEEVYVEKNQFIESGEKILKYTNGTYLLAPYDCYIINLNLPDIEGKVLNSHYIEISSNNALMITMNIDETNLEKINVGLEATIEISALNKKYKGNITHIASTGNNGKFEVEIEFENDGDIKIGMTGEVSITI